jgi:hypothetical protein
MLVKLTPKVKISPTFGELLLLPISSLKNVHTLPDRAEELGIWTFLSIVFLSANSLIHISKIGLKYQITHQNVSFYLRIQYLRSKLAERIYLE